MARISSVFHRGWRGIALLLLTITVAACTVTLVPPYDEQIDTGLTQLYGDTTVFVDRMIAAEGKPEGTYEANKEFYDQALGTVAALTVRAEAHRVLNDCPSSKLVARAFARANLPAEVIGQIGTLPKDDCQVVLMRLIKDNFVTMRDVHAHRGDRGLPQQARGQFLEGGVGALLRAAITVELAKRAG